MKLVWAIALLLSGCASSPEWRAVMQYRQNPYLYQDGSCRLWAREVQGNLKFTTWRVSWTATGIDPFAKSARHEILAYNVGREVWFVDNFSHAPRWVGVNGERIEVMAMQMYAGSWVIISDIRVN